MFFRELNRRSWAWILVAASLVSISAIGAVAAFNAPPRTFVASVSGDTYLSSDAPSVSHGTSAVLWVSHTPMKDDLVLIQFNLLGRLRPGDLVVQATMRLTFTGGYAAQWPVPLVTGRTLTSWQENTTTYDTAPLFAFDTMTTAAVGTDKAPAAGSTITIDLTKQMRRWQSYGGPSNFGTIVRIGSGVANATLGFASRDSTSFPAPALEVSFSPSPRTIYGYSVGLGPVSIPLARVE